MANNAPTTRTTAAAAGKRGRSAAAPAPAAAAAPADTAPADTAPADTAPADTAPADTAPAPGSDAPAPTAPALFIPTAPADTFGTPESVDAPTLTAYAGADVAGKSKIRSAVTALIQDAIRAGGAGKLDPMSAMMHAGHWQRTLDALPTAAPRKRAERPDPRTVIAARVATLRLAADLLAGGIITPDGLDMVDGDGNPVSIMAEWSDGALVASDIPDAPADPAAAERIAGGKITRAVNRNDIGAAIAAAFEGLDVGAELTVSQIITRAAAAGYDAVPAWNGRVTARLVGGKNGSTVPGIAHARIGAERTHGGRKVADA